MAKSLESSARPNRQSSVPPQKNNSKSAKAYLLIFHIQWNGISQSEVSRQGALAQSLLHPSLSPACVLSLRKPKHNLIYSRQARSAGARKQGFTKFMAKSLCAFEPPYKFTRHTPFRKTPPRLYCEYPHLGPEQLTILSKSISEEKKIETYVGIR